MELVKFIYGVVLYTLRFISAHNERFCKKLLKKENDLCYYALKCNKMHILDSVLKNSGLLNSQSVIKAW